MFANSSLIRLKNDEWLEKQRVAGKVLAGALSLLEREIKRGTSKSLLELDALTETYIRDNGCQPTFLGYRDFPNCCCCSVDRTLVHGIPTDYHLQDGDVVSFDAGATFKGAVSDAAFTAIYGSPRYEKHVQLVKATEEALERAIKAIAVGKRLGVIGQAIYKCGREYGMSVVEAYGGHGLDTAPDGTGIPHAPPFVSNRSTENEGPHIQIGMVLAIEPLFVVGSSNRTRTSNDGWSVMCDDICSHHEHTVFVHSDRIEVITERSVL